MQRPFVSLSSLLGVAVIVAACAEGTESPAASESEIAETTP